MVAALSMSGSSFIVAVNTLMLKRLRLPDQADDVGPTDAPELVAASDEQHAA